MYSVIPIPAFDDNYIWCLKNHQKCLLVDPGDAKAAKAYLDKNELHLDAILITHWHPDHTGGIKKLKRDGVTVYAPANKQIPLVDIEVHDGEKITVLGLEFSAIATPGHTLDHIIYYQAEEACLFVGDTLFMAGCGRLFEGSAEQMLSAMDKISRLPKRTNIYPAHEYSLANLDFACHVDPGNKALALKKAEVKTLRQQGNPSLPTQLSEELNYNPFLRCREATIIKAAEQFQAKAKNLAPPTDAVSVFAAIRACKDQF